MKSASPSWSSTPGENSWASDYSGEEDDGGTYFCPASAIKHWVPHLVFTSVYEGDDCTGAYWASANPGDGVAMGIVERAADTAVDPATDGDGRGRGRFPSADCRLRQRWSRRSAGNRRCRPMPTSAPRGSRGPCRPRFLHGPTGAVVSGNPDEASSDG